MNGILLNILSTIIGIRSPNKNEKHSIASYEYMPNLISIIRPPLVPNEWNRYILYE